MSAKNSVAEKLAPRSEKVAQLRNKLDLAAVVVNRVLPELFNTREEQLFDRLRQPVTIRQPPGEAREAAFIPTQPSRKFSLNGGDPLAPALLLVTKPKKFFGAVEKGPKQLGLPAVPGTGAHGANVDDGIASVQTTSDGCIWTSYYDEGVFGNNGWVMPLDSEDLVRPLDDIEAGKLDAAQPKLAWRRAGGERSRPPGPRPCSGRSTSSSAWPPTRRRCVPTVHRLMSSTAAIVLFGYPLATIRTISCSRGLSGSIRDDDTEGAG